MNQQKILSCFSMLWKRKMTFWIVSGIFKIYKNSNIYTFFKIKIAIISVLIMCIYIYIRRFIIYKFANLINWMVNMYFFTFQPSHFGRNRQWVWYCEHIPCFDFEIATILFVRFSFMYVFIDLIKNHTMDNLISFHIFLKTIVSMLFLMELF